MPELTENEHTVITKYDLYYESRMTKAEEGIENLQKDMKDIKTDTREIRADLKYLFGMMITFSTVMIGIMAHGFHWY